VDDAIVMLENIVRHMERGEDVMEASLRGSREIGFTIISMTLSLAAVFIPVLFMGGIVGRLLNEFAVTIGAAILISGVISLSLTPMMCSRWLRPVETVRHGRLYGASERFFAGMLRAYEIGLRFVLRHRISTMAVSALILAATVYFFIQMPKGFLPSEDQARLFAITEGAEGASFEAMLRNQQAVAAIAQQIGLKLVTFHAGFLPHETSDPSFAKLLKRITLIADLFAAKGIELGFETGQEEAETLCVFLEKLGKPNVGVNFDPANMILYDKGDPIAALRTLGPWLKQCHIKDASRTKVPGTWAMT
jgi:multidrug efflux pump subunit AcrB